MTWNLEAWPRPLVAAITVVCVALAFCLTGCANPLAPLDPCAKPASPKGCTPPSCAHPMCY